MKNKPLKIQILLLVIMLIIGLTKQSFNSIVRASTVQIKQSQPSPSPTPQVKRKRSTWSAILNLFKTRKEPKLGSRGVCPVSPGILEEKNVIWHNNPLFLWQGNQPLEIRLYSPFDPKQEQTILWSQIITTASPEKTFQGILYTGKVLQPGQIYDWEIFNQADKSIWRRSFKVMGLEERDVITKELKSIEAQLRLEQATDEEIALERANYFAKLDMWSDALQEMSSVENPSEELTQKVQELLIYICNPPKTAE
ncbi:hypothetical protein C7H19_16445 [Aphanothece hegewaldii CCALA 016]|uniref:DUF928 domain-containing protein n=1 Tax=Aphanothece hegewaldii CCALA 016 TaxID=2107694 RepID=A0A2T1LV93_9CHRO|nr:hypothetical protein [Aphanothece hegewaldii]PSF35593.1 hypothetical protein C7H19_16445 [Aphanothece hegewaldii CCALA 016]